MLGEPRRSHGNEEDDDYEDSPVPPPPKKKKKLKPPTSLSASGIPGGKIFKIMFHKDV